jgi:peptidoglycan/LPS O-acetylase OafA/YrhL
MQHSSFAARATAAFGMITTATLFSWFVVERPCMRWKRRVEARADRR